MMDANAVTQEVDPGTIVAVVPPNVQEALFVQRNIVTRFLAKIMSLLKCRYYKIKNTGCCCVFITH